MLDLDTSYTSEELFLLFANRLLAKTRPEYQAFLHWLPLQNDAEDPLALLALTGGGRETEALEIFLCLEPQGDGIYAMHFFSHGIRYLPEPAVKRVDTLCLKNYALH
jgi:hypothetical protein